MITQERLKELLHYDEDTGVFKWISKSSTYSHIKVGDIAGCDNGNGYLVIKIDQKKYQAHRLAFLYVHGRFPEVTDHINGVRDDNRIVNLREVTIRENSQNHKKQVRHDMSLPTGVIIRKWNGFPIAYLAQWYDISGKLRWSPNFNFKKLGSQENALAQAIAYREARISELVEQGAGYTDRHGTISN